MGSMKKFIRKTEKKEWYKITVRFIQTVTAGPILGNRVFRKGAVETFKRKAFPRDISFIKRNQHLLGVKVLSVNKIPLLGVKR